MKLNHDCVRELLLAIESLPSETSWYPLTKIVVITHLSSKSYSIEEISYAATCLKDANYIISQANFDPDYYVIKRLTWDGHQFLDNIRDDGAWKEVKKKVSILSSASIEILSSIASDFIKKKLGLS